MDSTPSTSVDDVTTPEPRRLQGKGSDLLTPPIAYKPTDAVIESARPLSRTGFVKRWALIAAVLLLVSAGMIVGLKYLWPTSYAVLTGHFDDVMAVAFSADGGNLATLGADGTVRIWDLTTNTTISTRPGYSAAVTSLAFSAEGKTLAVQNLNQVELHDLVAGTTRSLDGDDPKNMATCVAFSPDGKLLASAAGNSLRIWNYKTGTGTAISTGPIRRIAFSPDSERVVASGDGETIGLWNVADGTSTSRIDAGSQVLSVAFSPDGRDIALGHYLDAYVWRLGEEAPRVKLLGHTIPVSAIAYSPDGNLLATNGFGHGVRLWNAITGEHVRTLVGHSSIVSAIAFSADGKTIATASKDDTVRLWKV